MHSFRHLFLLRRNYRLNQASQLTRELSPGLCHLLQPRAAGGSQPVILPGMTGLRLHPFRNQQPFTLEAREYGINGSLSHGKLWAVFKSPDDLKPVQLARPQRREGGHLEGALAQLLLPAFGGLAFVQLRGFGLKLHCTIPSNTMYIAWRCLSRANYLRNSGRGRKCERAALQDRIKLRRKIGLEPRVTSVHATPTGELTQSAKMSPCPIPHPLLSKPSPTIVS